jgi:hypothetical protein
VTIGTLSGTVTAGDTVTLTFTNVTLGLNEAVTYTVQSGDTTTSIAAGLVALINEDSNIRANGIAATDFDSTANSFGSTIQVVEEGNNVTAASTNLAYTLSSAATETVSVTPSNGNLSTSPGSTICDMRGNGPAPLYSNATYPQEDEWWNPATNQTMDCSLKSGLKLQ